MPPATASILPSPSAFDSAAVQGVSAAHGGGAESGIDGRGEESTSVSASASASGMKASHDGASPSGTEHAAPAAAAPGHDVDRWRNDDGLVTAAPHPLAEGPQERTTDQASAAVADADPLASAAVRDTRTESAITTEAATEIATETATETGTAAGQSDFVDQAASTTLPPVASTTQHQNQHPNPHPHPQHQLQQQHHHQAKHKTQHVVVVPVPGGGTLRAHKRVGSGKALHKLGGGGAGAGAGGSGAGGAGLVGGPLTPIVKKEKGAGASSENLRRSAGAGSSGHTAAAVVTGATGATGAPVVRNTSTTNLRRGGGGSTRELKKAHNTSQTNLQSKRNSSGLEIALNQKREKRKSLDRAAETDRKHISQHPARAPHAPAVAVAPPPKHKPSTSVHFEIGSTEDAWEDSSNITSPAVSRSASRPESRAGADSGKHSNDSSQPHSPTSNRPQSSDGSSAAAHRHLQLADPRAITERLLQRTNSFNTSTTKMSLATATSGLQQSPSSMSQSPSLARGSSGGGRTGSGHGAEVISRFIHGSLTGTPDSPVLLPPSSTRNQAQSQSRPQSRRKDEPPTRAKSMYNLSERPDDDTGSALNSGSRRSVRDSALESAGASNHANGYIPPQQSRTQQKLWLQRASSHIEPQNGNGLGGMGLLNGFRGARGAGFDSARAAGITVAGGNVYEKDLDPRIRLACEKTGLEYLVVRRYQDPVGASLRRIGMGAGAGRGGGASHRDHGDRERDSGKRQRPLSMTISNTAQERIRELERERERGKGGLSSSLAQANVGVHGAGIGSGGGGGGTGAADSTNRASGGQSRGRHAQGQVAPQALTSRDATTPLHAGGSSADSQATIAQDDGSSDHPAVAAGSREADATSSSTTMTMTSTSRKANGPSSRSTGGGATRRDGIMSDGDRLTVLLRSLWERPLDGGGAGVELD